jgi:hypothetical protein
MKKCDKYEISNQMHNSPKVSKRLLYSYSDLHVSGTLAPIIRNITILYLQLPVIMLLGWLYLKALVCHYCRFHESSDRPKLEDTTNPMTWWLEAICAELGGSRWLSQEWPKHVERNKNTIVLMVLRLL